MLRLLGVLATVICAVAAAVLAWPGFFRLERTFPIAQIISFRGPLAMAFAALAVIALLLAIARPLRAVALSVAAIAALAMVVNIAVVVGRGVGTETLPARPRPASG